MVLTNEQKAAVVTRGKNLLVAAAAGSGKTKVLVERIKQLILAGDCDVDKLLVVTFTNAAAQEMRSRIHSALTEELRANNDFETLKRLERQVVLLSGASIMTMHSFCQMILKRNFSKIDLDPKFRVADEQELNLIKQDVIEELFESKYGEESENFQRFTDDFGGTEKGDDKLHEIILSLYEYSRSQPNPKEWLESLVASFDIADNATLKDTIWYASAMKHIGFILDAAFDECKINLELALDTKIKIDKIEKDMYDVILPLTKAYKSGNWGKIFDLLNPPDGKIFDNIGNPGKADRVAWGLLTDSRKEYKEAVENLQKRYFFASEQELLDDLRNIRPSVETLVNVTIEFSEALIAAKHERGIIDFSDMEHFALEILSDKKIANALRKKYQAVMVDEYQDTNGVQEAILKKIADEDKANFFAVGDVKQSIYKFRMADPSLFLDKYNKYPTTSDYEENNEKAQKYSDCLRIDLSKNFRSRCEVLDSVNFIFERLMNSESMEIDYTDDARLYYGMNYTTGIAGLLDTPTEFYLIENKKSNDNDDDSPQNTEDILSIEREAQVIADRIKEMININTQVYDKEENKYRTIKYRDIVILRRSKKNPAALMEVLQKNNIPAYAMGDETYFQALEIKVILSLLNVLENARQDIPLAAVMLSPIGNFTAEDLALLKIEKRREDLFTALITASASSVELNPLNLSEELMDKTRIFLQKVNAWRELSRIVSVPELLSTIYRETGYYDYVGGLPEGVVRQANLRMLVDRAAAYEATTFRGLSRFLKFVSKIKELNTDLAVARTLGENEDVVRVMTIHKSKGLEFPVVFVIELGKQFNTNEDSAALLLKHRELGIGPYITLKNEPLRYPTFARQVIAQKNLEEQKAEELRILYVAMTRAREKLILVATKKGNDKKHARYQRYGNVDRIPGFAALSANTFLDWLLLALSKETDCISVINVNANSVVIAEAVERTVEEIKPDMSLLARKMSTLTSKSIPSKMSVTELKQRVEYDEEITNNLIDDYDESSKEIVINEEDEEIIYKRPDFEQSKRLTGAEYGTLMHSVMQRLDLKRDLSAKGITQQIDEMIAQKIFTVEQAGIIRKNNAAKFFKSKIGRRMLASKEVYRELPFSRLIDASRFFPKVDDKIFIQGIVDVLFRDGDDFVLIDYKTDRITNGDDVAAELIKEKYKLQIELYSEAIEAILHKSISEKYLYMLSGDVLIDVSNNGRS
ncbi:MAG: helicase-exonuclease AddAB subunit AddA [Selenomonadaceae bacterium]|nr:helicase-exonuclease AddAB subunit AddA [Selenomonadaceae bacterium]